MPLDYQSRSTNQRPAVHSVVGDALHPEVCEVRNLSAATTLEYGVDCVAVDAGLAGPAGVTVPLAFARVKTVGVMFPAGSQLLRKEPQPERVAKPTTVDAPTTLLTHQVADDGEENIPLIPITCTRIRPPRDVVKLEDRLYYLLQPPLEQIFANETLEFPFRPFKYQFDGVAFLYPRNEAVLADEMGLGKTMQTIVTMRLLFQQGHVRRAVLVCPKPLVTNWQREFTLWAPELPLTTIEGKQSRREWLWENAREGVLIANYESLVRDRACLAAIEEPFDLAVIDESQRIKNSSGTTNEVVCSIPRKRSWALTGTPIENSVDDLVGIFQFVSPGCLRPQMKIPNIRRSVEDYIIRRTKDQVLTDLPPKMFRDADVELTPEQQNSYEMAEKEGVIHLKELEAALTIQHVFELVIRLKQICNFDPRTGSSAKFDRLRVDLEECRASGRKAIIFSQWTKTLYELRERLQEFGPLEYHGKIPSRQRDGVIETFRNDPSKHVILMSYGAGSVGLNLQFAGYVFLFDRWWNPAVEDQAINRAHRIGATGPVTVTRFLAAGTIEERINSILEEKRQLFNAVFDGATVRKQGLSRQEIFGLFNLRFPDSGILEEAA
ncbi:DEAD/DEAH box helicase [Bythopirellula polymerisocia]|uniref:ATP-dependent helicase HepA n=1 Tax=Bythopirellula polymerisocia TaxID=2528003 RepID=A0A5C6CHC5_9BACT|nr:DEAD/DEAH box helicase [Bythopirellula polymerisocia]TWU23592.1 ATP-dependent helicase HepA [Bythopirellula polymerisocia]